MRSQTLVGRAPDEDVARELSAAALSRAFFTAAALTLVQVAQLFTPMLGRPPGPDELEPFTLELIDWAATLGPDAQADDERAFADAGRAYVRLFERYDVVLSPTLARTSWPLGHLHPAAGRETLIRRTEEAVGYTPVHNAAGCPAMSVPLGRSDGLPVGMHVAAPPGADALLLALAYELEQAAPWTDVRPDTAWLERRA